MACPYIDPSVSRIAHRIVVLKVYQIQPSKNVLPVFVSPVKAIPIKKGWLKMKSNPYTATLTCSPQIPPMAFNTKGHSYTATTTGPRLYWRPYFTLQPLFIHSYSPYRSTARHSLFIPFFQFSSATVRCTKLSKTLKICLKNFNFDPF